MNKTFLFVLCTVIISYVETREVSKKISLGKHQNKLFDLFLIFQVRSAPRLVSDESILPHTPDLWKRGLLPCLTFYVTCYSLFILRPV